MPFHRYFRFGPFRFGFGFPYISWEEPPYLMDVERTPDEIILNFRLPMDVKTPKRRVLFSEQDKPSRWINVCSDCVKRLKLSET